MGKYIVFWEVVTDYRGNKDEESERFDSMEEAEKFMETLELEENCGCWVE